MDIPPLELPFVVGREAATPALPGGWPDMAATTGGRKDQTSTGRRLKLISRHHEVCDRQDNVENMLSAEEACMRLSYVDAIGSICELRCDQ